MSADEQQPPGRASVSRYPRGVMIARNALVAIAIVAIAGCSSTVPPTAPDGSVAAPGSPGAESPEVEAQILGGWRRSPIDLADSQIAIVSDACADAARKTLGEAEANLPTAVIDARGEGFATAILSDGDLSIVCMAQIGDGGATVVSVDRLSRLTTEPQDGASVSVVEIDQLDDRAGGRTIAYGRVGPDAAEIELRFDGADPVTAARAEGWWAAWWRGVPPVRTISGVESVPSGLVESKTMSAWWWLDPKAGKPAADAMTLSALVQEKACAGGKPALDRLDPPQVDFTETAIMVRLDIRRLPGPNDCAGNPVFTLSLELPEAVGGRQLLDGGTVPARDATKAP